MSAKVRAKDPRPAVFFRLEPSETAAFDALAGRLGMGRATVARHLVRWAIHQVGSDPAKLFSKR